MENENMKTTISDCFVKVEEPIYNYKSPDHKPPFDTDYCEIDVTELEDEVIRLTVGKGGQNFNKLTENNKIAWIFHNKETNKIEIWGNKNKFSKVKEQINNYIDWSKKLVNNRIN